MKKSQLKDLIKEQIKLILKEEDYDFVRDIKSACGKGNSISDIEEYLMRKLSSHEIQILKQNKVVR